MLLHLWHKYCFEAHYQLVMTQINSKVISLSKQIYYACKDGLPITIFATLFQRKHDEIQAVLHMQTEDCGEMVTPLIAAAKSGQAHVVRMLLQQFNVNIEQTGTIKFDGLVFRNILG